MASERSYRVFKMCFVNIFTAKRYEKLRAKAIKDGSAESTKNLMFLHLLNICKNQFKPEATRVALWGMRVVEV